MTNRERCAEALLTKWAELEAEKMKCIKRAWEIEFELNEIIKKCKRYGIKNEIQE